MREPNYVEAVANRLYEIVELEAELINLYALLVLTKGIATTLKDVHDAWSIWRSIDRPTHRSIVPFRDLTFEVQELDREYMNAIHTVALEMQTIQQ